jgi:hypothetical protein
MEQPTENSSVKALKIIEVSLPFQIHACIGGRLVSGLRFYFVVLSLG